MEGRSEDSGKKRTEGWTRVREGQKREDNKIGIGVGKGWGWRKGATGKTGGGLGGEGRRRTQGKGRE